MAKTHVAERLKSGFFARDTIDVARDLLGRVLVHRLPSGIRLSGKIVETEAYIGVQDPAAHSYQGRRTPRTEPMFGPPGLSYVYFIYGVYYCFNVVTAKRGVPEAVLIRALEPLDGVDVMSRERPQLAPSKLANGPGKLCIALAITRAQNALDLINDPHLWIERGTPISEDHIVDGARVGIGHSHDAVHWPLRFGVKDHPCLSPTKFSN